MTHTNVQMPENVSPLYLILHHLGGGGGVLESAVSRETACVGRGGRLVPIGVDARSRCRGTSGPPPCI